MHVLCIDRRETGYIDSITPSGIVVSVNYTLHIYPVDTRELLAYDLNYVVHPTIFEHLPDSEKIHVVEESFAGKGETLETESGFKVYFSGSTLDVVDKLRSYPAHARIEIMKLDYGQLSDYMFLLKANAEKQVVAYLSKKWTSAETGEKFPLNDAWINHQCFGMELTGKQIIAKTKKGLLSYFKLQEIISFFENDGNVREVGA